MTGKERFVTALKCGVPDRVPIFDFIDSTTFIESVVGRKPEDYRAQDIMDAPVDFPVKDWDDLRTYKLPDPELPDRMAEIELAQKLAGDRVAVVGGVQGPLTTAILISGLTNVLTKIIDDPRFVMEIFKLYNEYFKVAVKKMIDAHVDVICVPEDLGFVSGPFFSVTHFRKLLLPFIEGLFDEAISAGVPTFLHCDGALDGALILASDSDIRDEMPFKNVDLMFKTALQYGIYPIDVAAIEEMMKRCTVE